MRNLFTGDMGNRRQTFGIITEQLATAAKQTNAFLQVTLALSHAFSYPTIRGQWGERMVEDVLKRTGFQEGINYIKQTGLSLTSNRPDFTFLLSLSETQPGRQVSPGQLSGLLPGQDRG
ncbi:MAG: hypothetical protein KatS3mg114_0151 [Planctomycetaceae bacterium]|nr:MAG: hypothetical protein KatS3mg114_0151 [Planctomycetaceae bacterium]